MHAETDINSPAARHCQIRVVDADNRPVTGAVVEGETPFSWVPSTEANASAEWRGVTDDHGMVSFTISNRQSITFVTIKAGFAVGWVRCDAKPGEKDSVSQIELTASASVSGLIKDVEGRPIVDAVVWARATRTPDKLATNNAFRYLSFQQGLKYLTTRTGAGGSFKMNGLPQNATLELAVGKPGLVLEPRPSNGMGLPYHAGQSGINLTLVPAAVIEGRVVDEMTGAPIAGARVMPLGPFDVDPRKEFLPTGPDGVFRLANLRPGSVQIRTFIGTNAIPDWVCEPVVVDLKSGTTNRDFKITATRGGLVEVLVQSKTGDEPLGSVNLTCIGKERRSYPLQTTPQGLGRIRLAPGQYDVAATKSGWIIERGRVTSELGKTNRVILKATLSPRWEGIVRDADGKPAAHIPVTIIPRQEVEEDQTDDAGRFSLIFNPKMFGDAPGMQFFLMARDLARNLSAALELEDDSSYTNSIVQLQPGLTLAGQVIDQQGSGISNALVQLWLEARSSQSDLSISSATDAGGRFEIKALPVGWRYRFDLSVKGYGSHSQTVPASDPSVHRIELDPIQLVKGNQRVAGVVLDEAEKPVAGANVYMGGFGQASAGAFSDVKGRFLFDEVCDGIVSLSAQTGNTNGSTVVESGDTNVVLRLGVHLQEVQTGRKPRPEFIGTVVDPNGKPAPNIRILGYPDFRAGQGEMVTDAQGQFTSVLNPDGNGTRRKQYVFFAIDPVRNLAASAVLDEDATNANLRLEPAWTWSGRAIDANGAGITNAQAQAIFLGPPYARMFNAPVRADNRGRLEITGLPQRCSFRMDITAPGYGRSSCIANAPDNGKTLVETEPVQLITADLTLGGVVLDDKDQPIRGASINANGEHQPNLSCQTDRQGRFFFKEVCPGSLEVSATDSVGHFASVTTEGGDTNVVLRLGDLDRQKDGTPMPRIFCTVQDTNGNPARSIQVTILPGTRGSGKTDAQGRVQLTRETEILGTEANELVVFAFSPELNLAASVDLAEGVTNVNLRLEPAWTLAGRVIDSGGIAIANAQVQLMFHNEQMGSSVGSPARTDAAGRYEIRGLAQHRPYRLSVMARGYGPGQMRVEAPTNRIQRMEAAPFKMLAADQTLAGVVLDDEDQPVKAASIYFYGQGQYESHSVTDDKGRFLFKGVCPGPVQISASDPKGGGGGISANGGDTNIVIRFGMRWRSPEDEGKPILKTTGVIVDPDGKPAPNIRLVVFPNAQGKKTTDAQGRFSLLLDAGGGLGGTGPAVVFALDPARNLAASLDLDEETTNASFKLEPAWTLAGRVIDTGGAAVTNAQTTLVFQAGQLSAPYGAAVATDREGRFEIKGLPPGRSFAVNISAKGYSRSHIRVDAPEEGKLRVDTDPVQLSAANLTLGGVVLDDKDQPVKSAWIQYHSEAQAGGDQRSDSQGRFSIKGICSGRVQVSANDSKGRYATVSTEGGDTNIVLRLVDSRQYMPMDAKPRTKINGAVVDADGKPAANIRLIVFPFDPSKKTTDAQGRFSLLLDAGSGSGGTRQTVVFALDPARNLATSLDLDEASTNADFKLEPAWTLAGRVIDTGGAAVTNARAELLFQAVPLTAPYSVPAVVDREGRFEIKGLPPGRSFMVNISARGYGRSHLRVDAPEDGKVRMETDPIQLSAANLTLGGVVLDEKDQPVRGALVQFHSERQTGNTRLTDRQGRFLFKGVCPGRVQVSAHDFSGRYGSATAEGGDTNVTLRLQLSEPGVPTFKTDVLREP